MKFRIAKKIHKAIGTDREFCYSPHQKHQAIERMERLKSSKENQQFWNALMTDLGVLGRAQLLTNSGRPEMAFDILMRTPEEKWHEHTNIIQWTNPNQGTT